MLGRGWEGEMEHIMEGSLLTRLLPKQSPRYQFTYCHRLIAACYVSSAIQAAIHSPHSCCTWVFTHATPNGVNSQTLSNHSSSEISIISSLLAQGFSTRASCTPGNISAVVAGGGSFKTTFKNSIHTLRQQQRFLYFLTRFNVS